jgi:hypothetical protein
MRYIFLPLILLAVASKSSAQELYVFSEPASNMPSNTISGKLSAVYGDRKYINTQQRYIGEVMFGISRNLMIHGATTFSNMAASGITWEGAYAYGKYRFFSKDQVHRHFRMAAFTEASYSRNPVMFDEVSLQGDMSGVQGGLIATQLINKLAVSATGSYTKVIETTPSHHLNPVSAAFNYSLSAGYLVLPREYKSYDQLNVNFYTEFLGQRTFGRETFFIDAAPALQFIIKSNSKVNLGYRFELAGNGERSYRESFLVSFEHTFFNVWKKAKK